jgi:hypothetical protein
VLADHFKSVSDTSNYTQEFQQIKKREESITIRPDETGVEDYNKLFTIQELDHVLKCCKGFSPPNAIGKNETSEYLQPTLDR